VQSMCRTMYMTSRQQSTPHVFQALLVLLTS
jgi:hypothetical protein